MIPLTPENAVYNGKEQGPQATVMDGEAVLTGGGVDFKISFENGNLLFTDAGKYEFSVDGVNNYCGSVLCSFVIDPAVLTNVEMQPLNDKMYTGHAEEQEGAEVTGTLKGGDIVTLTMGQDYHLSYNNNVDAGMAAVTISFAGNYAATGDVKKEFKITRVPFGGKMVQADSIPDQAYTGTPICPDLRIVYTNRYGEEIELVKGRDYDVEIGDAALTDGGDSSFGPSGSAGSSKNIDVGDGFLTVTGKNNYEREFTPSFRIVPRDIAEVSFEQPADVVYTGEAFTPEVKGTFNGTGLTEGVDFEVTYSDNTEVGMAAVKIGGKGNFAGETELHFAIKKKQEEPEPGDPSGTEPNPPGTDSGTPSEGVAVLEAADKILEITEDRLASIPLDPSLPRIAESTIKTSAMNGKRMKVVFDSVAGATNYVIARRGVNETKWKYYTTGGKNTYILKNLKAKSLVQFKVAAYRGGKIGGWSNVSYRYYVKTTAKFRAGKKSFKATFKKVKGATGYQIMYSLKKNMAGKKTVVSRSLTKTIKKLKKGKKYYIRYRPIRKYKGKTYLGIQKSATVKVK